jgi:hypothetical protein
MEDGKSCGASSGCKCPCHKMLGLLIALIGVTFLLGNFDIVGPKFVATVWPILVILIGLKKSCPKGMCKCCPDAAK